MYGEPYWSEDAYYQFTMAQIEEIEDATEQLHQMCLKVVERVVESDELMARFPDPKHCWNLFAAHGKANNLRILGLTSLTMVLTLLSF